MRTSWSQAFVARRLDVEQAELGAGMRSFAAGDHPGARGPGRQADQRGEFDHPCAVAGGAVGLNGGTQSSSCARSKASRAR